MIYISVAFSSFGYVALYIAGKCQCFTLKGRGHAYKLCMVFIPLVWATLIAASRTADFHHHWQGNWNWNYLQTKTVEGQMREQYAKGTLSYE